MTDRFYTEFEASFRGTRELIMDRLRAYDDFLQPLIEAFPNTEVVDLGCGRGEWLEKMQSSGFAAHGVDSNEGMLQSCRDRGFKVHHGDALDYLATLADKSQTIVSAFHLVEHLQFEQMQKLIEEAMRVLRPAGLLIMETPNPENLIVATRNFYLDPTHQKPIPSELLTFMAKTAGFGRVKLIRLQESADVQEKSAPTLTDVVNGASPDYAVLARRDDVLPIASGGVWDKEFGLSLDTLLNRFDQSSQNERDSIQSSLIKQHKLMMAKHEAIAMRLESLEEWREQTNVAMGQFSQRVELAIEQSQIAKVTAIEAKQTVEGIYQSRSWKITAPLRWIGFQRHLLLKHGWKARLYAAAKKTWTLLKKLPYFNRVKMPEKSELASVGKYKKEHVEKGMPIQSPTLPRATRKMRIVIDMQGAQTGSRFRGIGRYSLAIAQAIIKHRGNHEIILVLNGMLDQSIDPIRDFFSTDLPPQNIVVWTAPGPVSACAPENKIRAHVAEKIREAFFASLQPDMVLLTSLFEGFNDDAVTGMTRVESNTLICGLVYDLIPFLNPEQYLLPNPIYADFYHSRVKTLEVVNFALTISESSRLEVINNLEFDEQRVVCIGAACDQQFAPIREATSQKERLCAAWGLTKPFVLYTGGADHRKNLGRLIEAFAALAKSTRDQYQLALAGKLSTGEVEYLQSTIAMHGLSSDEVKILGFLSDEELVLAYNLCHLFIFPSWHEGFGLPPLEAMACGAPVIAANTSSLPEVVQLQAAMFDPFSVASITAKLNQALTDEDFRQTLIHNGAVQATRFSWDATAQAAINAMERFGAKNTDFNIRPWRESTQAYEDRLAIEISEILSKSQQKNVAAPAEITRCLGINSLVSGALARTDLLPAKLPWRLEGPFDSSYSLALVNREFARALAELGHDVALHCAEGGGDFQADPAFLLANPDIQALHLRTSSMPADQAQVLSRFMYPPRVHDMHGKLNLLHCYGWEESRFPPAWVQEFNAHLSGITVMSQHVAKVLIDSGVRAPIAVSGIGVDHWERVQASNVMPMEAKTFRFLHVSSCFPRKGVQELLRAYGLAFRTQDDVTLVIKTFPNPHNEIHQWLSEIRATDASFPDVLIIEEDFSDSQLKSLYLQCQVLVAPSRAEGFGLPLAEAMLSGLAVVATAWSGQLDFCNSETAWLVNFDFVYAQSHFELSDSVWARPDVNHLSQTLVQVHQAPESLRKQRANAGRTLLLEKFTWRQAAQRTEHALRRWALEGAEKEPRIAWVSSWNTRCGIASYSDHLLAHMPSDVRILASHADLLVAEDDVRVIRCWRQGDEDTLENLAAAIESEQSDTVVIQFNYGFFDLKTLAAFMRQQIDAGRTVVIEMHSTSDPTHVPHKKLADMLPALERCHRILVHSVADMNRLKTLGLVNNVTLFPHGILDRQPRQEKSFSGRPLRVASYGYFLPHKGLNELVDAVVSLRNDGASVELFMVNAQYPAPISAQAIAHARNKIAHLEAQDYITLQSDYLDDARSLDHLSQADLIVFPYQETGESASGAVRFGIASGVPVAVTPLSIFDDVSDAVHRLPGTSAECIAKGIASLMQGIRTADAAITAKADQCAIWRADHRYSTLSIRFANMLVALHSQNLSQQYLSN